MSAKDQIKQIVDYFKREPQLKDKTDGMAEGLLLGANLADEANERSKDAAETTLAVQEKYKEQILTQDLNPNKDPELVDIRDGSTTAGERIRKFEQETNRQLAQNITDLKSRGINVINFGAKLDGITDDSLAFNDAAAFAREHKIRKIIVPGVALINETFDLTEMRTDGIALVGNHSAYDYGVGSEIRLNTGGIGIDATGTSRIFLEHIKVTSRAAGLDNPSTLGLLIARSEAYQFADRVTLMNSDIDMHSDPAANGGNGTIGVYNYAGEIFKAIGVEIKADIPMVHCHNNIFNVQSELTTIRPYNDSNTMTTLEFSGTITSRSQYGAVLQNVGEATFKGNSGTSGHKAKAMFKMIGDYNKNIRFDEMHIELFNELIELEGSLTFFDLSGIVSGLTDKVINMTTASSVLRNGKINLLLSVDKSLYPTGKTALIYNQFDGNYQLNSLELNLTGGITINAPKQRLAASKIISSETVSATEILVKDVSTYELICWDGTPSCDVQNVADTQQELYGSGYNKLKFNIAYENAGDMWVSTTPDAIFIKVPGLYLIEAGLTTTSLTGVSRLSLLVGGQIYASDSKNLSASAARHHMSTVVRCNKGQAIQAEYYHSNPSSIYSVKEGRNSPMMRVRRIGP